MSRHDEVNDLYKPSKQLDLYEKILFVGDILAALVSLVQNDTVSKITISLQVIMALLYFICNTVDDGHFWYKAEKERRKNSIQNGLGTRLAEYDTDGYYNNDLQPSIDKCAMNTLESNFFSKYIAEKMIIKKAVAAAIAVVVLVCSCIFVKDANILLIIAQTAFSSYVLVDFTMLILYKIRMESLYETAYNNLILGNINRENVAWLISYIVEYEAIKAHYKVRLDETIFIKNNAELSHKWQNVLEHRNIEDG